MSIRRTIILLTVPLFLALAMVNGALLYFQEKAEMSQALGEQALAAAVTSAEFIASMRTPRHELAAPLRGKALRAAASHVTGLEGLYLVLPGLPPQALVPPGRPWRLDGLTRPAKARSLPVGTDAGHSYVIALAPTTAGGFVAARIDAEPMMARMAAIQNAILLIVVASGVIATALGWFVARRIVRELDRNQTAIAIIGAGERLPDDEGLTIREARDLSDALRLMRASRRATTIRTWRVMAHNDRQRSVESALAADHDRHFAPVSDRVAGAEVALRMCGPAPLGSFFALCRTEAGGVVVLGRCTGSSPREELARAVAAREFLESSMNDMPSGACLAAAKSAHGIAEMRSLAWTAGEPPAETIVLALTDAASEEAGARYGAANRDAGPAEMLDGIELLLEPVGVFAALGSGGSAERGHRRIDVGLDREDAAEAADVEDLAHCGGKAG